jgi:hypothetical protein
MLSSTVTMTAETDGRLVREMRFLLQINQAENLELINASDALRLALRKNTDKITESLRSSPHVGL